MVELLLKTNRLLLMDDSLKQLLALGRGFYEKKQFDEAERYLVQVVDKNQSFADVYNMLGNIYHEGGHFGRAQRCFETALRLNPAYTEAALNLAVIYNDMGKYAQSREVYGRALERQQNAPQGVDPFVMGKIANMYADIGDVYRSAGLLNDAINEYQRALQLGPKFVDIRLKLADALRDGGQVELAVAEFQKIFQSNPEFLLARVNYGITLFSMGKRLEAATEWKGVLAKDPAHKGAAMYLRFVDNMKDDDNQKKSVVP
jgi:tetratricopeptide (TPR) repeat protein